MHDSVYCVVVLEESLDYVKWDDVFFRCPGCHKVCDRDIGKGITTPYFIFSVLNAVAAMSELPEGNVQPEPINKPPGRAVIKQVFCACPPATISTGSLPTEGSMVTDVTDPVVNPTSNVVADSSKHKAPEVDDNHAKKKSCASEKRLLANEGGKKSITNNQIKQFRTSDGSKKKSVVAGAAEKKSDTLHSCCNNDEDYVLGKALIS
ncbi:hypothetical protein EV702DRAFT_1046326 [Suillus placidus]|uniref:Uncharacterized protein n=1 Tax=Suillus placidus TaxID=48579 RepID=A0A9P7D0Y9_9AGAM|nr:hypothetical protein EV702DRAFT_1046326 [Suillus placidus]